MFHEGATSSRKTAGFPQYDFILPLASGLASVWRPLQDTVFKSTVWVQIVGLPFTSSEASGFPFLGPQLPHLYNKHNHEVAVKSKWYTCSEVPDTRYQIWHSVGSQ